MNTYKLMKPNLHFECAKRTADMKSVEGGWHCDSCKKKVLDFTQLTDEEVFGAMKDEGSVCMQIQTHRIQQPLMRALASTVGVLTSLYSFGQATIDENSSSSDSSAVVQQNAQRREIKGSVINNHGEPVAFTPFHIVLELGQQITGLTNKEGKFNVSVKTDQSQFTILFPYSFNHQDTTITVLLPNNKVPVVNVDIELISSGLADEVVFVEGVKAGGVSYIPFPEEFRVGER